MAGPQLRFVNYLTEIGCVNNCVIIIIIILNIHFHIIHIIQPNNYITLTFWTLSESETFIGKCLNHSCRPATMVID